MEIFFYFSEVRYSDQNVANLDYRTLLAKFNQNTSSAAHLKFIICVHLQWSCLWQTQM